MEGDTPLQELHPLGAFGASILAALALTARRFGASFLAYIRHTHLYFSNTPSAGNRAANGLRPALSVAPISPVYVNFTLHMLILSVYIYLVS